MSARPRFRFRGVLAAALLTVATACPSPDPAPPDPSPPGPAPAGTIRLGYPWEPPTLDPVAPQGGSYATRDVLRPVLPALYRLGPDLRPEPELAAGWPAEAEFSFDPFTVTLRLRDASWSDGTPITASDVRFSWERLRDGPTGARYRFLRDVEVLEDRSLRLHFDRTVRRWWALFSIDDMVLPAHAYSEEWGVTGPTVAGGPFLYEGRTPGLSVRLRRNGSWWGEPPAAEAIEVVFVPNDEIRLRLLDRGELDVLFAQGDSHVGYRSAVRGWEEAEEGLDEGGGASGAWGAAWWELAVNHDRLGDRPALVEALRLGIDRSLAAELLGDSGQVMDGIPRLFPAAPPVEEGLPGLRGPWPGADLQAARRVLEDAGLRFSREALRDEHGAPVELMLAYPAGSQAAAGSARFVHFQMRELGIRVEVVGVDPQVLEAEWIPEGRADLYLVLRRGADAPDATAYRSEASTAGRTPGIDEVLDLAESAVSRRRLVSEPVVGLAPEAWAQAQVDLARARTVLPLVRVRTWVVARPGVSGPEAIGSLAGPLWNAAGWRIRTSA